MKICPNCGTENNDNALKCILCEFEFETEECADNIVSNTAADVIKSDSNESLFDISNKIEASKDEESNATKDVHVKSDFESPSTSKGTSKAIIAIVSVLVVGGGIAGGMYFIKNQNTKPNASLKVAERINQSTTLITTTSVSTSISISATTGNNSTVTTTLSLTTTTIEQAPEPEVKKIDTSTEVKKALNNYFVNHKQGTDPVDYEPSYALLDVNKDGIDELFISYHDMVSYGADTYVYNNGEYVKATKYNLQTKICLSEGIIMTKGYEGGEATDIYVIANNELLKKEELTKVYGNTTYYHNDYVVTENEYNQYISKYNAMDWIDVSDYSTPVSNLIDISPYRKTENTEIHAEIAYTVYDTSAAGNDFSFNNEPYTRKVATDSGSLNLRSGPSLSADIILQMPKDSLISLWGVNSEWAYVSYNNNGTTYYGYASRQFISVP